MPFHGVRRIRYCFQTMRTGIALRLFLCFLVVISASAQDDQDTGSQAAGEYTGPAILSRGAGSMLRIPASAVKIRPYLGAAYVYSTGLIAVATDPNGDVRSAASQGIEARYGVTGYKQYRRSRLGLDYRGAYNHYNTAGYFSGVDQTLAIFYERQLSRRATFSAGMAGSTTTRGSYFPSAVGASVSYVTVPTQEIFDGRTTSIAPRVDLTYQKSARLSFNLTGSGYAIRRRSSALFGVTGYTAGADMVYRASRRTSVGASYSYNRIEFTKAFGGSDIHSAALIFSRRLGPTLEFSSSLGASRVETLTLHSVPVDPILEAILGTGYGLSVLHRINYIPTVGLQLTKSFHNSSLTINGNTGTNPGNGLYLTSRTTSAGVSYSYLGIRKWNFSVNLTYQRLSSLAQELRSSSSAGGGIGATYQLTRGTYWSTRLDYNRYRFTGTALDRNAMSVRMGIDFSPGDYPLALW